MRTCTIVWKEMFAFCSDIITSCKFAFGAPSSKAECQADRAAVEAARDYLDGAIRHAPGLGGGHGPLNHFWRAVY